MRAALRILRDVTEHRRLLFATTRIELEKRYAGSVLGFAWIVLNPMLFLAVYVFLYVFIFKSTLPGSTRIGYTVFVFTGLIPFLAFMEASNGSVQLIKANLHFVKNLVFPADLIPVRQVLTAFVGEFVGLAMLVALAAIDGSLSWKMLLLPGLIAIQFLLLVGTAFLCAGFGLMLPDFGYFLGTFLTLLLFLSPIGFKVGTLQGPINLIVVFNPFTYMIELFRWVLIPDTGFDPFYLSIYVAISIAVFVLGSSFFYRLRAHLVDYE